MSRTQGLKYILTTKAGKGPLYRQSVEGLDSFQVEDNFPGAIFCRGQDVLRQSQVLFPEILGGARMSQESSLPPALNCHPGGALAVKFICNKKSKEIIVKKTGN